MRCEHPSDATSLTALAVDKENKPAAATNHPPYASALLHIRFPALLSCANTRCPFPAAAILSNLCVCVFPSAKIRNGAADEVADFYYDFGFYLPFFFFFFFITRVKSEGHGNAGMPENKTLPHLNVFMCTAVVFALQINASLLFLPKHRLACAQCTTADSRAHINTHAHTPPHEYTYMQWKIQYSGGNSRWCHCFCLSLNAKDKRHSIFIHTKIGLDSFVVHREKKRHLKIKCQRKIYADESSRDGSSMRTREREIHRKPN